MLSYQQPLKDELRSLTNDNEYLSNLRSMSKYIDDTTSQLTLMETMIRQGARFIIGKQEIATNDFLISKGELCCGFYSLEPVSFDLFIGNDLQNHYDLEPNKFYNIINKENQNILLPLSGNQNIVVSNIQPNNLQSTTLYYVGIYLENEERKETILTDLKEIIL